MDITIGINLIYEGIAFPSDSFLYGESLVKALLKYDTTHRYVVLTDRDSKSLRTFESSRCWIVIVETGGGMTQDGNSPNPPRRLAAAFRKALTKYHEKLMLTQLPVGSVYRSLVGTRAFAFLADGQTRVFEDLIDRFNIKLWFNPLGWFRPRNSSIPVILLVNDDYDDVLSQH